MPRLLWLLDTNVLSNTPSKLPNAACEARLKRNASRIAVPAPVWHELMFGWLRRRGKPIAATARRYSALAALRTFGRSIKTGGLVRRGTTVMRSISPR